jgi:hypothetical protein
VIESAGIGSAARPKPTLRDFSAFSGLAPRAPASGVFAGNVLMSNGTPPTKFVAVEEKYSCMSEGARKPVLTAPRMAYPGMIW